MRRAWIGAVVAVCAIPVLGAAAESASTWARYYNAGYGFGFEYPRAWSATFPDAGDGGYFRPRGTATVEIRIFASHNSANESLRGFAQGYWLGATTPLVSHRDVTLAGLRGVRSDFRGQIQIVLMRVFPHAGEAPSSTFYVLLFSAPAARMTVYRPVFEHVIRSFVVGPGALLPSK